jgi:hypothetical protein
MECAMQLGRFVNMVFGILGLLLHLVGWYWGVV